MSPSRFVPQSMRIARPVKSLAASLSFYVDTLGLEHLGGFEGHDGYDGAFVGAEGVDWHIEFTCHVSGEPSPQPTSEDLVVLYVSEGDFVDVTAALGMANVHPVAHENPYWASVGAAVYRDPDGYLVVLCPPRPD